MKRNKYLSAIIRSTPPSPSILVILAILAILVGCNRSETTDEKKIYSDSLEGAWELREVRGGMVAGLSPYYSQGNGNIWRFSESTLHHYAEGKLVDSGTFTITRDTCPATQTEMDAFILSNSYSHHIFFEISKDTLTLYNGIIAADGTIEKYVRINNPD